MGKPWYLSRTLWFNLLALIVAVATAFGFADFEPSPLIDHIAVLIVALVNLWLRTKTSEPVRRGP